MTGPPQRVEVSAAEEVRANAAARVVARAWRRVIGVECISEVVSRMTVYL